MTQTADALGTELGTVLKEALSNTDRETVPVSDVVNRMVARGHSRDEAVARLQREIEAGHVTLTRNFFLTNHK